MREVLANLDKLPGVDEPIVVTCASGHRGGMVMAALRLLGYTNVRNLNGGVNGWKKLELPVVTGVPAAPAAINTPIIADQALYDMLNGFLSSLPGCRFLLHQIRQTERGTGRPLPPSLMSAPRRNGTRTATLKARSTSHSVTSSPEPRSNPRRQRHPNRCPLRIRSPRRHDHDGPALDGLYRRHQPKRRFERAGSPPNSPWKAGWIAATVMADFITTLPANPVFSASSLTSSMKCLSKNRLSSWMCAKPSEIEANGYIAGAIEVPIRDLLKNLDKLPAQDQKIVITCAFTGHRGSLGMMALRLSWLYRRCQPQRRG